MLFFCDINKFLIFMVLAIYFTFYLLQLHAAPCHRLKFPVSESVLKSRRSSLKVDSTVQSQIYTAWKVSKYGVFLVRIFPHSDWIRGFTSYLFVFSANAGKCGAEKTPYLDTFHAVILDGTYWIFRISDIQINGS